MFSNILSSSNVSVRSSVAPARRSRPEKSAPATIALAEPEKMNRRSGRGAQCHSDDLKPLSRASRASSAEGAVAPARPLRHAAQAG